MIRFYTVEYICDGWHSPMFTTVTGRTEEEARANALRWNATTDNPRILQLRKESLLWNLGSLIEKFVFFLFWLFRYPTFFCIIFIEMLLHYDPQMFRGAEHRKDPYRRWVYWVSFVGYPLYWLRLLFGTRKQLWIDSEKRMLKERANGSK